MESKNALAELAERLEVEAKFAEESGRNGRPIYNASRIVSELAKVKDIKEFCIVHVREDMAIDAVENCRAIAEEGAGNGK